MTDRIAARLVAYVSRGYPSPLIACRWNRWPPAVPTAAERLESWRRRYERVPVDLKQGPISTAASERVATLLRSKFKPLAKAG